ncbi:hypothetical protein OIU84_007740 [Salix udensis]|uniref:RING-type E3 ubiquitin transferase n=1 Tax=Salix udensis TaxID=889485 RepID=A0AAD6JTI1_9ROSI|nr:hypothetical protein OIU84_007740 [Salix udensis]
MCREERCKKHGPVIRFPFRIKGKQPDYCGYPGFDLSCTDRKETLLELPTSMKLYVNEIDYASQLIVARDPDECLPKQIRNFSLSRSPFGSGYKGLIPSETFEMKNTLHLNWSKPHSGLCEQQGKFCRRKNSSARIEIECYDKPKSKEVAAVGSVFLLLVIFAAYRVYSIDKAARENQKRIETFLADYKSFKPTRYMNANLPGRPLLHALEVISEAE